MGLESDLAALAKAVQANTTSQQATQTALAATTAAVQSLADAITGGGMEQKIADATSQLKAQDDALAAAVAAGQPK